MDVTFSSRSVQELQNFLKVRGVIITGLRKLDLVHLCEAAHEVNIEIDPDGFLEDREEVIGKKLQTEHGSLPNPGLLSGSPNLSILPRIGIMDIYNYLITFADYDHAGLRDFRKMEGYTMHKD